MAGIAADQHSHVKYFPCVPAYDDYDDILVGISEVGVESFATRVQELLVAYLRATYGDGPANWCRDFWTGDRGRMCLAHDGMPDATTTWASKSPGKISR